MANELANSLRRSAQRALQGLEDKLLKGDEAVYKDLALCFKAPQMFIALGQPEKAKIVLSHIKHKFTFKDGEFMTSPTLKSSRSPYCEFRAYMDGWITRAAYQVNDFEIVGPAYKFLMNFYDEGTNGFLTNDLKSGNGISDVLTTAHHGLINLERGTMAIALAAGE